MRKKTKTFLSLKKVCLPMRQGSILAYALIVISMMLAIAASLSISAVIERKSASSTNSSMQALQIADGGINLVLKKINDNRLANPAISTLYSGCGSSGVAGVIPNLADAGQGTYDIKLYNNETGTIPIPCSDQINNIRIVKSIGKYKDTVRAISVAIIPDSIPIAWWNFDEDSGPTASDSKGGYTGTIVGATWNSSGKSGSALNFNGMGSVVTTSFPNKTFGPGFTVEAWINTNIIDDNYKAIVQMNTNDNAFYLHNKKLNFWENSGAGCTGTTEVSSGEWHHVAMTFDLDNNIKLYLDGNLNASCPNSGAASSLTWNVGYIGALSPTDTEAFEGSIDEVKIFDSVLTPTEIQAEFEKN